MDTIKEQEKEDPTYAPRRRPFAVGRWCTRRTACHTVVLANDALCNARCTEDALSACLSGDATSVL